jgi:hypothetical protein
MEKQEILDSYWWSKQNALKAMEQYASQEKRIEAIGFAEFIRKGGFIELKNKKWSDNRGKYYNIDSEQLYEIYKKG